MLAQPVINYAAAIAPLTRLAHSITDFTPFFEGAVDTLARRFVDEQFQSTGRAGGTPWPSLSPTTLALKAERHRAGMGIGRDSNAMYESLAFRSHPLELRQITKTRYRKGTRVHRDGFPYALAFHDGWEMRSMFGTPVPPRSVLPRPIYPEQFPANWLGELQTALNAYVAQALPQSGAQTRGIA